MNGIQLLLFGLIATFQTAPLGAVTRFKMKTCVKTRKVYLVIATPEKYFQANHHELIYFAELKNYVEKLNSGHLCFSITLTLVTAIGIFEMATKRDLEDLMTADEYPYHYFLSSQSITNKFDESIQFLERYKKDIAVGEDKLLMFFKVDSTGGLIKELGEVRKVTPVIVILRSHLVSVPIFYPELILQFPLHRLLYFPSLKSKRHGEMYQYILPAFQLVQNPEFDRFKFIGRMPFQKNISCLRNTTVVWPFWTGFYLGVDVNLQLSLLYEYFLVTSRRLQLRFYPVSFTPFLKDEKQLPALPSSFNGTFELLHYILKKDWDPSVITDYCNGEKDEKVVLIIDKKLLRLHGDIDASFWAKKNNCFVEIEEIDEGYPYLKKSVLYYSNKRTDPVAFVNLLFDALINIGC